MRFPSTISGARRSPGPNSRRIRTRLKAGLRVEPRWRFRSDTGSTMLGRSGGGVFRGGTKRRNLPGAGASVAMLLVAGSGDTLIHYRCNDRRLGNRPGASVMGCASSGIGAVGSWNAECSFGEKDVSFINSNVNDLLSIRVVT